jgi:hypothetical protein
LAAGKKRSPTFYLSGKDDSVHWLCPDRETLDAFLARLFDFLNWQFYTAAALFEVILSWLHFLELHQLISASVHQKTLRDLQGLRTDLRSVLRKADLDPALQSAIENWEKETPPETS